MYGDCEHEYSWDCECECDHWCWHTYEWECREQDCDCENIRSSPVFGDEESSDMELKDIAVLGGLALAAVGVVRLFGRKSKNISDSSEHEGKEELDAAQAEKPKQIEPSHSVTKKRLPPAGWYQEGVQGQLRWWDGEAWTEHYQNKGIAPGWYDDGAGSIRWWDGRNWTNHVSDH